MNYREHDHKQQQAIIAIVELKRFKRLTPYKLRKEQRSIAQEAYQANLKFSN